MARIAIYKQVESILNDYCTPTKIKHRRCNYIESGWETELVYCVEKSYFEDMTQELQKIDESIKIEKVSENMRQYRNHDYTVSYNNKNTRSVKNIKIF